MQQHSCKFLFFKKIIFFFYYYFGQTADAPSVVNHPNWHLLWYAESSIRFNNKLEKRGRLFVICIDTLPKGIRTGVGEDYIRTGVVRCPPPSPLPKKKAVKRQSSSNEIKVLLSKLVWHENGSKKNSIVQDESSVMITREGQEEVVCSERNPKMQEIIGEVAQTVSI